MSKHTPQRKWQPFVPAAHANAQLVLDHGDKSTIDTFFLAGARVETEAKFAEVFATSPHGLSCIGEHYHKKYLLCNETAFLERDSYWRSEILFDLAGENRMEVDFLAIDKNKLLVRATAINNSPKQADWTITFLSAVNANCGNVSVSRDAIEFGNGEKFNVTGLIPLFEAPPLNYRTSPMGLRVLWGATENAVEYPHGFMPRYQTFRIPQQSKQCHWYLLGIGDDELNDELILPYGKRMDFLKSQCINTISAKADDPNLSAMNHLAAQIKFNRRYPPRIDVGMHTASFTACPSMDIEYNWDAGYSAMGLVVADPELAMKCIEQYLPGTDDTVWPKITGALIPTQILATWDLFQRIGDRIFLRKNLLGLHRLLTYCSGTKDLPYTLGKLDNLDPQKDGLITLPNAGSGLDDCPSQVWSRGYEIDWARQESYWAEPIAVNPTGNFLQTNSVNATAFVVLSCKLLKLMRNVLNLPIEPLYDQIITRSENSLTKFCWNEKTQHFHWVETETLKKIPVWDLSGLTPLFSSTWNDVKQRDQLLETLINIYLTDEGLTTSNLKTEFDREGYWCGAIWFPLQWNFFKALLGTGQLKHARKLAKGLVSLYRKNHEIIPACFEKFDARTRMGCGDLWFGALASPILGLWAAYYQPGCCTLSYLTIPKSIELEKNLTTAKLTLRCDEPNSQVGALIVLQPEGIYKLTHNGETSEVTSDEWGSIEFLLKGKGVENSLLLEYIKKLA